MQIKHEVNLVQPRTHLTPRTVDGEVNAEISTTRVLPIHSNPRHGWRTDLGGQHDADVLAEISREFVTRKSVLRTSEGFKDSKINKYEDRGIQSNYSKINRVSELTNGRDGSTMILDCKEALYHIGAANKRQVSHMQLRSAYDSYSSSGEPTVTCSIPPSKLLHATECLDYIFYSEGPLVVARVLSMPSWQAMRSGETPEASQAIPDYCHANPFAHSMDLFDMLLQRLLNKLNVDLEEDNQKLDFGSTYSNQDVARVKNVLQIALARSYGSTGTTVGTKPISGKKKAAASRTKSPPRARRTGSLGTGALGPDYMFYGGRWAPFAIRNPARANYYLPNGSFGSTHLAIGAEFLFDDSMLTTTYAVDS